MNTQGPGRKQHRVAVSHLAGFGLDPLLPSGRTNRKAMLRRTPLDGGDSHRAHAEDLAYSVEFFTRTDGGSVDRALDSDLITPIDHAVAPVLIAARNGKPSLDPDERVRLEAYAGVLTLRSQDARRQIAERTREIGGTISEDDVIGLIGRLIPRFLDALKTMQFGLVRFDGEFLVLSDVGCAIEDVDLEKLRPDIEEATRGPVVMRRGLGDRVAGAERFVVPVSPSIAATWQPLYRGAPPPTGDRTLAEEINRHSLAIAEREIYSSPARALEQFPGTADLPPQKFDRYRRPSTDRKGAGPRR